MAERDDVRWGLARRFELIEWRAYWQGRVNRGDLEERFGVSTPQASLDLRQYQEAAPGNLEYNPTEKTYMPTAGFRPKFLRLSADLYLMQLNAILNGAVQPTDTYFGSPPSATVMQTMARHVENDILQAMLRAIERRWEVDIEYQSLTERRRRWIAPHSLASDGHRWHARAWCCEHKDFRDFVLARMISVHQSRASEANPNDDIEWQTMVELKIEAHPDLQEFQRVVIERDYGMEQGVLIVKTRAALAFYLVRRLNLDLKGSDIPPERKQICLVNLGEVEEQVGRARAEMKARSARRSLAEANSVSP